MPEETLLGILRSLIPVARARHDIDPLLLAFSESALSYESVEDRLPAFAVRHLDWARLSPSDAQIWLRKVLRQTAWQTVFPNDSTLGKSTICQRLREQVSKFSKDYNS